MIVSQINTLYTNNKLTFQARTVSNKKKILNKIEELMVQGLSRTEAIERITFMDNVQKLIEKGLTKEEIAKKLHMTTSSLIQQYGLCFDKAYEDVVVEQKEEFIKKRDLIEALNKGLTLKQIAECFKMSVYHVCQYIDKYGLKREKKPAQIAMDEVYRLMAAGYSQKDIAKKLNITVHTMRHLVAEYYKMPYKEILKQQRREKLGLHTENTVDSTTNTPQANQDESILDKIYDLMGKGFKRKEIAKQLGIKMKTLKFLVESVTNKSYKTVNDECRKKAGIAITEENVRNALARMNSLKEVAEFFHISIGTLNRMFPNFLMNNITYNIKQFSQEIKNLAPRDRLLVRGSLIIDHIYDLMCKGLKQTEIAEELKMNIGDLKYIVEHITFRSYREVSIMCRENTGTIITEEELRKALAVMNSPEEVAEYFNIPMGSLNLLFSKFGIKNKECNIEKNVDAENFTKRRDKLLTISSSIIDYIRDLMDKGLGQTEIAKELKISVGDLKYIVDHIRDKSYREFSITGKRNPVIALTEEKLRKALVVMNSPEEVAEFFHISMDSLYYMMQKFSINIQDYVKNDSKLD